MEEKMNNWLGVALFLVAAAGIACITAFGGLQSGVLLLVGIFAIPLVYAVVAYPQFGIMAMLVLAYLVFAIIRLGIDFPAGTLIDGIEALLILGFFIKQKKYRDWSMVKHPVGIMILVWIAYNLFQAGNPSAESRLAWLYTIRSVAFVMLTYFIFALQIRTIYFLRLIIRTWILLAVLVALYALKQQFIGFSGSEQEWLNSDPMVRELLFIAGQWRKFSFLSDPVVFSYTMVISSILCACIAVNTQATWKKVLLVVFTLLFLYSMLFSGTRGAYVMVPAAMVFYAVINLSRKVLLVMAALGVMIAGLIFVPIGNPTIQRFQSAFKPSADASFNTRKTNQERIKPFILSHPLGGGLGATGVWGQRFAPYSFLANFPPDSGYVRVAVELGWLGLLLFCVLMFVILKTGIDNYYRIRDPELKTYCLAMVLIVFALNIGNYPQEALVQFPTNIYFYLVVAIIVVTNRLDRQMQKPLP
ncbi:O-antigen ligase family protein [Sediminibacterium sp. WSJ-3]|nr:O-antigen ligase family protein [Sediminibacterium soli]